jgi:hypothetical protein
MVSYRKPWTCHWIQTCRQSGIFKKMTLQARRRCLRPRQRRRHYHRFR